MTGLRNTHGCPAPGCSEVVPNSRLACRKHWYQLSKPVRDAIWATAGLSFLHDDRRAALNAATEEWSA